jgi:hypothetical protein
MTTSRAIGALGVRRAPGARIWGVGEDEPHKELVLIEGSACEVDLHEDEY